MGSFQFSKTSLKAITGRERQRSGRKKKEEGGGKAEEGEEGH